jgi:hypothetical protein
MQPRLMGATVTLAFGALAGGSTLQAPMPNQSTAVMAGGTPGRQTSICLSPA